LQVSFDYIVNTGTYASGDLAVYLYDVTNAQVIQPAGYSIENVIGPAKHRATFQTNSNSTSYRLIIHTASTSTQNYELLFDNFNVGPQVSAQGAVVTDWAPLSGASASMTKNTTMSIFSRRVGGVLEARGRLLFSGAPNNVPLTITIPYTINTATLGADKDSLGTAHFVDAGTNNFPGKVVYNNTTSVSIYSLNTPGTYVNSGDIGNTVPFTYGSGDSINFEFTVPIVGWGTSQVLSQDTDTRVVAARMTGSGFTSTANVNTKATFTTTQNDTHGALSSSTYTVKVPGYYDISANLTFNAASWTSTQRLILYYRIDSSDYEISRKTITTTASQVVEVSGSAMGIKLNAGQTVEIRVLGEVAVTAVDGNFGIAMRSGPSQIAATETVSLQYNRTTSQSVANSTEVTIIWNNKLKDTHGMMNTSTGVATIPISGAYLITAIVDVDGNASGRRQMTVLKNATAIRHLANDPGFSGLQVVGRSVQLDLIAGDTIAVYLFQDSGATRTITANGGTWNGIEITRVGN
jgi:hypothetical protein